MGLEQNRDAGIYCRLSNDDERSGESVSIENQKLLLQKHVKEQGWKEVFGFDEQQMLVAVEKYREYYSSQGIYENSLYEGVDGLLRALKDQGKSIYLATSKPTFFANQILKYFCVDSYFDFVSGSELNGERSNKDEVIQYALHETNITDLERCVMVGDRKMDIFGAKAAGIKSIGVLFGYGRYEELAMAGADTIVSSVSELAKLLNCDAN